LPDAAPVTSAVLSFSLIIIFLVNIKNPFSLFLLQI
jgi:hypothetical protein